MKRWHFLFAFSISVLLIDDSSSNEIKISLPNELTAISEEFSQLEASVSANSGYLIEAILDFESSCTLLKKIGLENFFNFSIGQWVLSAKTFATILNSVHHGDFKLDSSQLCLFHGQPPINAALLAYSLAVRGFVDQAEVVIKESLIEKDHQKLLIESVANKETLGSLLFFKNLTLHLQGLVYYEEIFCNINRNDCGVYFGVEGSNSESVDFYFVNFVCRHPCDSLVMRYLKIFPFAQPIGKSKSCSAIVLEIFKGCHRGLVDLLTGEKSKIDSASEVFSAMILYPKFTAWCMLTMKEVLRMQSDFYTTLWRLFKFSMEHAMDKGITWRPYQASDIRDLYNQLKELKLEGLFTI